MTDMNDPFGDTETLIARDKVDEARAKIAEAVSADELTDEEKGEIEVAFALARMNTLLGLRGGVSDALLDVEKQLQGLPERERTVTEAHSLASVRQDLKA